MNKIFIIGLPRTGTTSISVALLDYGLKVAHTAYTKQTFQLADVISDAPCFSDYQQLDKLFPSSKFIYLDRTLDEWLPSIQRLLLKMKAGLDVKAGVFNPVLKRSFNEVFSLSIASDPLSIEHLRSCYLVHKKAVMTYFADRDDLLTINVSHQGSLGELLKFIGVPVNTATLETTGDILLDSNKVGNLALCLNTRGSKASGFSSLVLNFPHLNKGKRVADWKQYKHPNKVNSNSAGKDRRRFFDY
ncbi:sulfotransferase [uncultured Shewanella sp.]|uniref:sulfotransferase n=1 Tax=uncultured Shewanella sp. TaxID=173975 RepID=UPI002626C5BE|nr:sulfotransferase [uncultured Shewanella sp.]